MSDELRDFGLGSWTRRRFVQLGAASAVGLGVLKLAPAEEAAGHESMMDVAFEKRNPRIAMIGVGGRGTSLLGNLLAADAQVVAVCDIVQEKADHAAGLVVAAGQKKPALYTNGPHDYERLVASDDVDLVLAATPWSWHAPMALAAMKNGKDVAIEVPGVTSIEDCWKIVQDLRRDAQTLHDAGELLLRLQRDADSANDSWRGIRRPVCMARARISTICARSCFRMQARDCGGGRSTRCATAICIQRTDWGR